MLLLQQFFKKWWAQLIVIVISCGVLLIFKDQNIIAGGDSFHYLDFGNLFESLSSTWNPKENLGNVNLALSRLAPMVAFWKALDLMQIPIWLIQRFWMLVLSLSAGLGLFYLVINLFRKRTTLVQIGAIIASMLYLYNMFIVNDPVQVNSRLILAILPWILLLWMKGLNKEKFDFRFSLWIGIISLLMASSASNIASIAVVPIILGCYFVYHVATKPKTFKRSLVFALATIANCLLFNLWWITTSLVFMTQSSQDVSQ
ncbi:alpha-(1-_3)-arabinofuranosyltransferase family protein, partial [Patescibacteria group bacterium]